MRGVKVLKRDCAKIAQNHLRDTAYVPQGARGAEPSRLKKFIVAALGGDTL